jgi:hypothetical protein
MCNFSRFCRRYVEVGDNSSISMTPYYTVVHFHLGSHCFVLILNSSIITDREVSKERCQRNFLVAESRVDCSD